MTRPQLICPARSISKVGFDALAGYCRASQTALISRYLDWCEYERGLIVCTLIVDLIDNEFGGIILARDELERYRWIGGTVFCNTPSAARQAIDAEATGLAANSEIERKQGDSTR